MKQSGFSKIGGLMVVGVSGLLLSLVIVTNLTMGNRSMDTRSSAMAEQEIVCVDDEESKAMAEADCATREVNASVKGGIDGCQVVIGGYSKDDGIGCKLLYKASE